VAIHDRWYKDERAPDPETGKLVRTGKQVRTAEYGCEKRWQVRWRDEQGKQCKESYAKKADAERADSRIKTQLADGSYVDPKAGQVTLRSFAEDWRKNRVHDDVTAERIEANLRNHVYSEDQRGGRTPCGGVSIGDYPLGTLAKRPSLLQAWIKGMPLGANTKLLVIGYVSQIFRAAVADRIIGANPLKADSVQKPDPVKTEAIPWTAAQVAAVAGKLPDHLAAIPYLGAATGLRQGELFAVALDDLNFLRRVLHIEVQVKLVDGAWCFAPLKNHKTCKARDVPLDDPVLPIMAEHVRVHPPVAVTLPWHNPEDTKRHGKPITRELLFTVDGGQLERNVFNWWWVKAWKSAGVPDRGPRMNGCHVMRHTAASAWLSAGMNIAKVAALLGDTKEVVLRTYAHFMPEDDDQARAVMKAFFGALETTDANRSAPDVPGVAR
jgi:integrase